MSTRVDKRWVAAWTFPVLLIACGGREASEGGAQAAPKTTLETAVAAAVGDASKITIRKDWDDGSGGEAERAIVVEGAQMHYFLRDPEKGWHHKMTHDGTARHGPQGITTEPGWIGWLGDGSGGLVVHFPPGSFSVHHFRTDAEGIWGTPGRGTDDDWVELKEELVDEMVERNPGADPEAVRAKVTTMLKYMSGR